MQKKGKSAAQLFRVTQRSGGLGWWIVGSLWMYCRLEPRLRVVAHVARVLLSAKSSWNLSGILISLLISLPNYECRTRAKFGFRMLLICLELQNGGLRALP